MMKAMPVNVSDAKHLLDIGTPVIFVDARNPTDWSQSATKLPGAIRLGADDVSQHLGDLPSDGTVVTYCT